MYHCFRLTKGMDLKKEIEQFAINNKISEIVKYYIVFISKYRRKIFYES